MADDEAFAGYILTSMSAEELRLLLRQHRSGHSTLPLQSLKDRATCLLGQCALMRREPPPQLALLISELMDDSKDELSPLTRRYDPLEPRTDAETSMAPSDRELDLNDLKVALSKADDRFLMAVLGVNEVGVRNWNKAVDVEAGYPPDPTLQSPSTAAISHVAKSSGATRDTIRRWREHKLYRNSVDIRRRKRSETSPT